MASVHQAAAKRKTAKKKFKGKYPGPDKYKGKPPPKKKKAVAKKVVAKPAAKKAAAPAVKPNDPNLPTGTGVGTDSNGNLKLQTNADIENMVLEAAKEQQEAIEAANMSEGESLIKERVGREQALDTDVQNRTKNAGYMATRGMHGTAAMTASAKTQQAFLNNRTQVNNTRNQESQSYKNALTSAESTKKIRDAEIANARDEFTHQQSATNPTVGTTPVNSGVTPTKATPVAVRKAAVRKAAVAKPKAKAKAKKKPYKGKRPGPG